MDTETRRRNGRLGAHISWARTPVRSERTAPARRALEQRFLDEVDPDRVMSPQDRARAAESARAAYYQRLSRKGVEARRRKKAE